MKQQVLRLSLLALFSGAQLVRAGSHIWSGAASSDWSNPANWSAGGVPAFGEANISLTFPANAVRFNANNDITGLAVKSMSIQGNSYFLYGNGLTFLNNGIGLSILCSGTNHVISLTFTLNSPALGFSIGSGSDLQLENYITGPGGFTKFGYGTLWLDGWDDNDFQSAVTVSGGRLVCNGYYEYYNEYFGSIMIPSGLLIGSSDMSISPRVELWYANQLGYSSLTLNPNGTLEVYFLNYVSSINMTGGIVRLSPTYYDDAYKNHHADYGQLTCYGDLVSNPTPLSTPAILNTPLQPGNYSVYDSALTFYSNANSDSNLVNVTGGQLYVEPGIFGDNIHKTGAGELVWMGGPISPSTLSVDQGQITGTGANAELYCTLTISSNAQFNLQNTAHFTSTLHLNGQGLGGTNGALVVQHDGVLIEGDLALDSDAAIVVQNAADTLLIGTSTKSAGAGNFFKKGPGTLQVFDFKTNQMTGALIVDQGILALNSTNSMPFPKCPASIGRGVADGTTAELRFLTHNQVAETNAVTLKQTGVLNLYGFNGATGPLTLAGGSVITYGGTLTLTADLLATNALTSTISGNMYLGQAKRAFDIAPGFTLNIYAPISDLGYFHGFDVDGGGTLVLHSANTSLYGPINVKAGLLYARADFALGIGTGTTFIQPGARLNVDGRNLGSTPIVLNGDGGGYGALNASRTNTINGTITLASDTTINAPSATDRAILGGQIVGAYSVHKIGAGTLVLTGNQPNTYTGTTTLEEGTLELNKSAQIAVPGDIVIGDGVNPSGSFAVRMLAGNQFSTNSVVTLNNSGMFDLGVNPNTPQTIASLSGSGPINLGFSILTTGGNNADAVYGGSLTGFNSSSLIKQGTGRLSLFSVSPNWSGSTVVAAGNLSLDGSQPMSPVFVNPGGTFSGNGTSGNTSGNGGKIMPGNSVGLLHTANFTLNPSSVFEVELNGTNAGVTHDQVSVTGGVSLGGATLNPLLGFNSSISNKFVIIANDGVDPVISTFNGLPEGATFALNSRLFQISYHGGDGNDVELTQISAATPPQIGGITRQPDGSIQLSGTGLPGANFTVQANADLTTTNWVNLGSVLADQNGHIQFNDPNASNFTQRFYRFFAQ